jgi:sugar phosphate isomerase/epimerase
VAIFLSVAAAAGGTHRRSFSRNSARWLPILNAFEDAGVDVCFELHPGEDLHDGATFERFLSRCGRPQAREYSLRPEPHDSAADGLSGLSGSLSRAGASFHVKDAEYRPSARSGVFMAAIRIGSTGRAASGRSAMDRSISTSIFSKMAQYDYPGWAVLEWECCLKHPEAGAAEGAKFIKEKIIRVTDRAFDDFAGSGADMEKNRTILGLDQG